MNRNADPQLVSVKRWGSKVPAIDRPSLSCIRSVWSTPNRAV
jgi:hypothetical protein